MVGKSPGLAGASESPTTPFAAHLYNLLFAYLLLDCDSPRCQTNQRCSWVVSSPPSFLPQLHTRCPSYCCSSLKLFVSLMGSLTTVAFTYFILEWFFHVPTSPPPRVSSCTAVDCKPYSLLPSSSEILPNCQHLCEVRPPNPPVRRMGFPLLRHHSLGNAHLA